MPHQSASSSASDAAPSSSSKQYYYHRFGGRCTNNNNTNTTTTTSENSSTAAQRQQPSADNVNNNNTTTTSSSSTWPVVEHFAELWKHTAQHLSGMVMNRRRRGGSETGTTTTTTPVVVGNNHQHNNNVAAVGDSIAHHHPPQQQQQLSRHTPLQNNPQHHNNNNEGSSRSLQDNSSLVELMLPRDQYHHQQSSSSRGGSFDAASFHHSHQRTMVAPQQQQQRGNEQQHHKTQHQQFQQHQQQSQSIDSRERSVVDIVGSAMARLGHHHHAAPVAHHQRTGSYQGNLSSSTPVPPSHVQQQRHLSDVGAGGTHGGAAISPACGTQQQPAPTQYTQQHRRSSKGSKRGAAFGARAVEKMMDSSSRGRLLAPPTEKLVPADAAEFDATQPYQSCDHPHDVTHGRMQPSNVSPPTTISPATHRRRAGPDDGLLSIAPLVALACSRLASMSTAQHAAAAAQRQLNNRQQGGRCMCSCQAGGVQSSAASVSPSASLCSFDSPAFTSASVQRTVKSGTTLGGSRLLPGTLGTQQQTTTTTQHTGSSAMASFEGPFSKPGAASSPTAHLSRQQQSGGRQVPQYTVKQHHNHHHHHVSSSFTHQHSSEAPPPPQPPTDDIRTVIEKLAHSVSYGGSGRMVVIAALIYLGRLSTTCDCDCYRLSKTNQLRTTVVCFMVATKMYLEGTGGSCTINKAFSEASHIPLHELCRLEVTLLYLLDFALIVDEPEARSWCHWLHDVAIRQNMMAPLQLFFDTEESSSVSPLQSFVSVVEQHSQLRAGTPSASEPLPHSVWVGGNSSLTTHYNDPHGASAPLQAMHINSNNSTAADGKLLLPTTSFIQSSNVGSAVAAAAGVVVPPLDIELLNIGNATQVYSSSSTAAAAAATNNNGFTPTNHYYEGGGITPTGANIVGGGGGGASFSSSITMLPPPAALERRNVFHNNNSTTTPPQPSLQHVGSIGSYNHNYYGVGGSIYHNNASRSGAAVPTVMASPLAMCQNSTSSCCSPNSRQLVHNQSQHPCSNEHHQVVRLFSVIFGSEAPNDGEDDEASAFNELAPSPPLNDRPSLATLDAVDDDSPMRSAFRNHHQQRISTERNTKEDDLRDFNRLLRRASTNAASDLRVVGDESPNALLPARRSMLQCEQHSPPPVRHHLQHRHSPPSVISNDIAGSTSTDESSRQGGALSAAARGPSQRSGARRFLNKDDVGDDETDERPSWSQRSRLPMRCSPPS